eukprot:gb/GECG01007354.1/.p1 GENE.gb/GECG01007354.1/~~gb/GECG01007354.1/.p1  ORF type:complete len:769 (+),score=100.62 gb/GECG01007354.1/:1-2307(+)
MGVNLSNLHPASQWSRRAKNAPAEQSEYARMLRHFQSDPATMKDIRSAALRGWDRLRVYVLIERLTRLGETIQTSNEIWDASQSFRSEDTSTVVDLFTSVSMFENEATLSTIHEILFDILEASQETLLEELRWSNWELFQNYAIDAERVSEDWVLESTLCCTFNYAFRSLKNDNNSPRPTVNFFPPSPKKSPPRSPESLRKQGSGSRTEFPGSPRTNAGMTDKVQSIFPTEEEYVFPCGMSLTFMNLYHEVPEKDSRSDILRRSLHDLCDSTDGQLANTGSPLGLRPRNRDGRLLSLGSIISSVILACNCSELERRSLMFVAFDNSGNGLLEEAEMATMVYSSVQAFLNFLHIEVTSSEERSNIQLLSGISRAAFFNCDATLRTDGHVTYSELSEWIREIPVAKFLLNALDRAGLFLPSSWAKYNAISGGEKHYSNWSKPALVSLHVPKIEKKPVEESYHKQHYGKDSDGVIRAGLAASRHKRKQKLRETITRQRAKQRKGGDSLQNSSSFFDGQSEKKSAHGKPESPASKDYNSLQAAKSKALTLFDLFVDLDVNDSGRLTQEDWNSGISNTNEATRKASFSVSSTQHEEMMRQLINIFSTVDADSDGGITFDELLNHFFPNLDRETRRKIHIWVRTEAIQRRRKGMPAGGFAKEYKIPTRTSSSEGAPITSRFSSEEERELRQIFDMWDTSKNGVLSKGELVRIMRQTDIFTIEEAEQEFRRIKAPGRDYLTFGEFKNVFGDIIFAVSPYKNTRASAPDETPRTRG